MRQAWSQVVEAYRASGILPAGVPADHVARTMIATAQGFIAQRRCSATCVSRYSRTGCAR